MAETGDETLIPTSKAWPRSVQVVTTRRPWTDDTHEFLSGRRCVGEDVEAIRGVSRSESVVAEREVAHVGFDVHRSVPEAAAEPPRAPDR